MARRVKFALEMKDGFQARNDIEEIRHNFDYGKVVGYLADGRLQRWLEDRGYGKETAEVSKLQADEADLKEKLCAILKVDINDAHNSEPIMDESLRNRLEKVKQYTADKKILDNIAKVATNQEELLELVQNGESEIYLCADSFIIPLVVENVTYIGIANPTAVIKSSAPVNFKESNIVFKNIAFDDKYAKLLEREKVTLEDVLDKEEAKKEREELSSETLEDVDINATNLLIESLAFYDENISQNSMEKAHWVRNECINRLMKIDNNVNAIMLLGGLLEDDGRIDDALNLYLKAIGLGEISAYTFAGMIYHYKGEYSKAKEMYALAAEHEDPLGMYCFGVYLYEKEYQKTQGLKLKYEAGKSEIMNLIKEWDINIIDGLLYIEQSKFIIIRNVIGLNDIEGGLETIKETVFNCEYVDREAYIDEGEIILQAIKCYDNAKNVNDKKLLEDSRDEIVRMLLKAVTKCNSSKAMLLIGGTLEDNDKIEDALSWYLKAIEHGEIIGCAFAGMIYHKRGNYSKAKAMYEKGSEKFDCLSMYCLALYIEMINGSCMVAGKWKIRSNGDYVVEYIKEKTTQIKDGLICLSVDRFSVIRSLAKLDFIKEYKDERITLLNSDDCLKELLKTIVTGKNKFEEKLWDSNYTISFRTSLISMMGDCQGVGEGGYQTIYMRINEMITVNGEKIIFVHKDEHYNPVRVLVLTNKSIYYYWGNVFRYTYEVVKEAKEESKNTLTIYKFNGESMRIEFRDFIRSTGAANLRLFILAMAKINSNNRVILTVDEKRKLGEINLGYLKHDLMQIIG